MEPPNAHDEYLRRLRAWREPAGADLSLGYLSEHVRKQVVLPAKRLEPVLALWRDLIPPALADRTSLAAFSHGVLTVHVDDSASLYRIDRMLRGGLERRLCGACKTTLRRVRLKLKPAAGARPQPG